MLTQLREAIDRLEIPVDREALIELISLSEQLHARVIDAVGEFDNAALWDIDGATSMTAWLRDHGRMSRPSAHWLALRAKRLRKLPRTAAAMHDGALSVAQVDAILQCVRNDRLELFAEHETALLPTLAGMSADETAGMMRNWRELADDTDDDKPQPAPDPAALVHLSDTFAGRYILDGSFDADNGEIVSTALEIASNTGVADIFDRLRTPAQVRGDALVDICRFFLDNQHDQNGVRNRPHITLVADLARLEHGGRYLNGTTVDPEVLHTLLCDSDVCRVLVDAANILDLGAVERVVTKRIRGVLVVRDEHCRFPGCDRPAHWCDAHHVVAWEHGGPTVVTNLILLCRRHHHRIHRRGWTGSMDPDGTFTVTDPAGRTRTTHPPGLRDRLIA